AIVLGKALFWDMQVGSDGVQACASCHFNAGADSRSRNQVSPGRLRVAADGTPSPDAAFDAVRGPNAELTAGDFPLSPRTNDVVSSQGIARALFDGLGRSPRERLRVVPDQDGFRVGRVNVRRVEPRNAPTVINAVFNHRSFWDGRARNVFNGVNGLGDDDPDARVWRADDPNAPVAVRVRLEDSSLASQATSPPVSDVEMSASGRTFHDLGAKLTRDPGRRIAPLRPLEHQWVHPDDGVLGPHSRWPRPGLDVDSYRTLIAQAFQRQWWDSPRRFRTGRNGAVTVVGTDADPDATSTLLEQNFALVFGLAVQLYEATLVADDSPYDRFMDGDAAAITPAAVLGVDLFRSQTRGRCINCHEGAELTGASVRRVRESPVRIREGQALDRGFNNIGVLPTREDPGVGGTDPLGHPLSTVRALVPPPAEPIAVDGAMKVPGLRNVALTAPYFHNGGILTLGDVLRFYSRGGDVRPQHSLDGSLEIAPLNVLANTPDEIDALEAFLLSLTDERVLYQRAPFDHPSLLVPDGALGDARRVLDDGTGTAVDRVLWIAPVGRTGGPPLRRFLE
ncbi:MAG TPA: cytochrome c peroxidase, partial [Candidatus Eisenbacteria bacterium]|nr:cytochrome c peroxidase [Candidatus Eisenbacteria bacterium]